MTCFWDGIINSLDNDDINLLNLKEKNIINLINILKIRNCPTYNIKCQNQILTDNQIKENMNHITDYNINDASKGYLCSTFDPFLFLLSHILNKPIHFMYCGHKIIYLPSDSNKKPLNYMCDKRHFWKV